MEWSSWYFFLLVVAWVAWVAASFFMDGSIHFPSLNRDKRRARKRKLIAERNAHLLQVAVDNHAIAMKERRSRHLAQLNQFNEKAGFALECEVEPEPKPAKPSPQAKLLKMQERAYEKTIEELNQDLDERIKRNKNYERGRMANTPIHGALAGYPICGTKATPYFHTNDRRGITCPDCIKVLA